MGEYCVKISVSKLIENAIKLVRCIGFLYKAVHKIGLFSVLVFPIFFTFIVLTFERIKTWS